MENGAFEKDEQVATEDKNNKMSLRQRKQSSLSLDNDDDADDAPTLAGESAAVSESRLEINVDTSPTSETSKDDKFFLDTSPKPPPPEKTEDKNDSAKSLDLPSVETPVRNVLFTLSSPHSMAKSWFGGCFEPVITYFKRRDRYHENNWEIPFVDINDLRFIGSGSQGAVFAGKWRNREVAVKKVRDAKDVELRHLRKLKHRNIVEIAGVCTQAPCYAIIMEFCPYGQLYDVLSSNKSLPASLVWDWMHQVASGMHYLHSQRIVHRDLKSPNILVGHNYILKISDFGNSRQFAPESSTRMSFAGTVAWMAPEVVRNEPCSDKVDVWSYGIIIWELLTGATPYNGIESAVLIMGIGYGRFALPIPTNMPDGCRLLMTQCWNPKPRNRPTFRQILMHLEILSDELLNSSRFASEQDFHLARCEWKESVTQLANSTPNDGNTIMTQQLMNGSLLSDGWIDSQQADLVKKREEELRHVTEIRQLYEEKLRRVQALYLDLSACMLSAREREVELERRENELRREASRLQTMALAAGPTPPQTLPQLSHQLSLPPPQQQSQAGSDNQQAHRQLSAASAEIGETGSRFSASANGRLTGSGVRQRIYDQNSSNNSTRPLSALNLFGGSRDRSVSGKRFVRRSFTATERPNAPNMYGRTPSGGVFTVITHGKNSTNPSFTPQAYHDYGAFSLPAKRPAPLKSFSNHPEFASTLSQPQRSNQSMQQQQQQQQQSQQPPPIRRNVSAIIPSPINEQAEDSLLTDQEEKVKEMKRHLSARSLARLAASSAQTPSPAASSPSNSGETNGNGSGCDTDSGVVVTPSDC